MNTTGSRIALVAGGTGLVGSRLVPLLLAAPDYRRVVCIGRRKLPIRHPGLEQRRVDFDSLANSSLADSVDDVFCCLGTTMRAAGSRETFRRVDHDYVLAMACAALVLGAGCFVLVSAVGANRLSRNFYLRVKGQTEAALDELGYRRLVILRPGLLLGARKERRPGERFAALLAPLLGPLLLGPLSRYRGISADRVAAAMLGAAQAGSDGHRILYNADIERLAAPILVGQ